MSKKPVRVGTEAEEETREAVSWYEQEHPGLGAELWEELDRILRLISENPGMGNPVPGVSARPAVRRMPLRRFPY